MESTGLTSSQADFLKQCEEEFKDRYTDRDEAFMKIKKADPKKPPIIDPWHNKPRRPQHDWSQNYGHNRPNSWDRRNDRNERHERSERIDRHAGKHHLYQRHSRPY
ncbi:uncharacterized protein LOC117172577 [Belonocnema kinseyi]|uniref:uncharacterized protein LOC117172577 n=1 Tax=Belonocnema kinseyi TaxID=2817044 RepID=UPI00143D9985|nr:uncharacterized protein LOC117172577 [Belonocnema kinseyi]XP_033216538.1 uncharacterized protein LOC117172577 [Belonocnema kinseyi]